MEGEELSQLPQRVRGAAREGPGRSAQPGPSTPRALPEDLRQRIQAAVAAERANAAQGGDRASESSEAENRPEAADGDQDNQAVNGINVKNGRKPVGKPGRITVRVIADVSAGPGPAVAVPTGPDRPDPPSRRDPPPVQSRPDPPSRRDPPPALARPGPAPKPQADVQRRETRPRRFGLAVVVIVALVAVLGSLGALVSRHLAGSRPGNGAPSSALPAQEAATRDQAAAWVAQQVSTSAIVSCDRVMCAALAANGFPARNLLVLGPTSPEPVTSAVIVATAAVRSMFGSSLGTALAPEVLASFGSGPAAVTIRVIAPDGATAYRAALRADQVSRKANGSALLNDPRITFSAVAREQLAAGDVDSRLLLAVAAVATDEPIDVVQFGNVGPGGDPALPLRCADLVDTDPSAHMMSGAYVRSLQASLGKLNTQVRPARTVAVVLHGGQAVLRVEFTAPSPLGLFGTQGSP